MIRFIILCGKKYEYEFVEKCVKNINLRIRPDGAILVSANKYTSINTIENFMVSKQEFIVKALERFKKTQRELSEVPLYADGQKLSILGKPYTICSVADDTNEMIPEYNTLILRLTDKESYELRKKVIEDQLARLCEKKVLEVVSRMYPCFRWQGIEYPQVKFRHMKSMWGNCRPNTGLLTFNTMLVCAPLICIEYVVVHEFVHFLHPNHSKAFYECLERYMPDWKERKKELGKYTKYLK